MIISFVHQIHSYSSMFNVHVHARSRWLGWFFSFPPWCIIFFSTLLLLKPAPARETSAQLVIFISSSIILKHFKHQSLQISSMKIDLLFCISYCRCHSKWRNENCNKHWNVPSRSQLHHPSFSSARLNLSSFYSPPKGERATPSLSSTTGASLWHAAGETPQLIASLGAVAKMNGLNTQHWGRIKISLCPSYQSSFSANRGGPMQLWW